MTIEDVTSLIETTKGEIAKLLNKYFAIQKMS